MEKDFNIQEEEFNMQDIVNDPYAMFNEHIWLTLPATPRDPSVWTKTPKEKAILKRMRKYRFNLGNWGGPVAKGPVKYRLTIHLASTKPYSVKTRKGVKVVCQTTVSTMCYPEDVADIVAIYRRNNDVRKYHYNGKTYEP